MFEYSINVVILLFWFSYLVHLISPSPFLEPIYH